MECVLKGEGRIPVNCRPYCLCSSAFNVAESVLCPPADCLYVLWREGVQNGGLKTLNKRHNVRSIPAVRPPGLEQSAPLRAGSKKLFDRVLVLCLVRRIHRRSTSHLRHLEGP